MIVIFTNLASFYAFKSIPFVTNFTDSKDIRAFLMERSNI